MKFHSYLTSLKNEVNISLESFSDVFIKISMSDFLNYSDGSFIISALSKLLTIRQHLGKELRDERIQNSCFLWRNSSHWIIFWTTHTRITQRFVLTLIYSCSFNLWTTSTDKDECFQSFVRGVVRNWRAWVQIPKACLQVDQWVQLLCTIIIRFLKNFGCKCTYCTCAYDDPIFHSRK